MGLRTTTITLSQGSPLQTAPPVTTIRSYLKRIFQQVGQDIKSQIADTVIATIIIIGVLLLQFRLGWIKTGEGWSNVVINLAPTLGIFAVYLSYHLIRAPYELDKDYQAALDRRAEEHRNHVTELNRQADRLQRELEKTQRMLAFALDRSKPKLLPHIAGNWVGSYEQGASSGATVLLAIRIGNQGAPSIADNWLLTVKIPNREEPIVERPTHPGTPPILHPEDKAKPNLALDLREAIYIKVGEEPIVTGGKAEGWLLFFLKNISHDAIYQKGTQLIVSFSDVMGEPCEATVLIKAEGDDELGFFRGITQLPEARSKGANKGNRSKRG